MSGPSGGVDTIEDVLEALDSVIEVALERRRRVGYFAAVYRQVTAKVLEGVETGFFDDGERMAHLDVTFAKRYLSALSSHEAGHRPHRGVAVRGRAGATRARPLGWTDRSARRPGRPTGTCRPAPGVAERRTLAHTHPGEQRRTPQHRGPQPSRCPRPRCRRDQGEAGTQHDRLIHGGPDS